MDRVSLNPVVVLSARIPSPATRNRLCLPVRATLRSTRGRSRKAGARMASPVRHLVVRQAGGNSSTSETSLYSPCCPPGCLAALPSLFFVEPVRRSIEGIGGSDGLASRLLGAAVPCSFWWGPGSTEALGEAKE
ncbi:uncharacterized protein A4U43_C08F9000 [Asparagus officinalis]|nr:uncharacterized protein A4U43_C08F9000 [Asparagus officinalis]